MDSSTHQILSRAQWPNVSNNINYRDNRFVYGYVFLSLFDLIRVPLNFVKKSLISNLGRCHREAEASMV